MNFCDLDRLLQELKEVSNSFQDIARSASGSQVILRSSLTFLSDAKGLIDSFLSSNGENQLLISKKISEAKQRINRLKSRLPHFVSRISDEEKLEFELNLVASMADRYPSISLKTISEAIKEVRDAEKTFIFQQKLLSDKQAASQKLHCEITQFSYGSTSFRFWENILRSSRLMSKIASLQKSNKTPHVVILGSSQGLLCIFTALIMPSCTCVGYEILPTLHNVAVGLKNRHNIGRI